MAQLALDLAKRTGYAIRFEDGSIKCGEWHLGRGGKHGARNPIYMARLWRRLFRLAERIKIDVVIYEETFAIGEARFQLDSLQYATLLAAVLLKVRWVRVNPTKWKKAVVGNGRAKRDEYYAFAARNWPQVVMWTDNHAAAVCLLAYLDFMEDLA